MWYLNPKNLLLMAAAVLIIVIGGLFLWQRVEVANQKTTIAKQAASILDLQKANADLQGQVADYKANIAAMKKAKAEQQAIADSTASLLAKAQTITANCIIGGDDEKVIDSITFDFNNHGMLPPVQATPGGAEASGKVLPNANAPNAGSPGLQRWTVKQIVENYLAVIDYTLQLEKTVNCYEAMDK